jgi:hypothetical protein
VILLWTFIVGTKEKYAADFENRRPGGSWACVDLLCEGFEPTPAQIESPSLETGKS